MQQRSSSGKTLSSLYGSRMGTFFSRKTRMIAHVSFAPRLIWTFFVRKTGAPSIQPIELSPYHSFTFFLPKLRTLFQISNSLLLVLQFSSTSNVHVFKVLSLKAYSLLPTRFLNFNSRVPFSLLRDFLPSSLYTNFLQSKPWIYVAVSSIKLP